MEPTEAMKERWIRSNDRIPQILSQEPPLAGESRDAAPAGG
jgi:hypothetical protein